MNKLIKYYITKNRNCCTLLLVFFFAGTAAGAYYTRSYDSLAVKYMEEFFSAASNIYKTSEPSLVEIFKSGLLSSVKSAGCIWLMGFTVIGIVFVFLAVAKNGFMCGFLSGFLINLYGSKGVICSAIIIMAKCFISIPAMIFLACESVSFSKMLIKLTGGKFKYRINFKKCVVKYTLVLIATIFIMVLYALFEAYISGNILKVYLKS